VAATQIGMELGRISTVSGAALICAGLLSVVVFPAAALTVLRRCDGEKEEPGRTTPRESVTGDVTT
jgi:hypothetical protein